MDPAGRCYAALARVFGVDGWPMEAERLIVADGMLRFGGAEVLAGRG